MRLESESKNTGTRVRLESESKDSSPHLCNSMAYSKMKAHGLSNKIKVVDHNGIKMDANGVEQETSACVSTPLIVFLS